MREIIDREKGNGQKMDIPWCQPRCEASTKSHGALRNPRQPGWKTFIWWEACACL